jgi:hypothetical protein
VRQIAEDFASIARRADDGGAEHGAKRQKAAFMRGSHAIEQLLGRLRDKVVSRSLPSHARRSVTSLHRTGRAPA